MTNTRRVASKGVRAAAWTTGRTSSTSSSCAPLGETHMRSGWARRAPARGRAGSGASAAAGRSRTPARRRASPPPRAVEHVGVTRPSRRQGGSEDGRGVRVGLEHAHVIVISSRPMARGRLITIEGLDGAGKTTQAPADAGARGARARRGCCASPEASRCPNGCASWCRTRRTPSRREPKRCCTPPPGPSSWRSCWRRCSRRAVGRARPLRGLLARLPGRRAGAGRRRGARHQRLRHGRPDPRPHRAVAGRSRHGARPQSRPGRPTASSAGGAFFEAVARVYEELAAAEPDRIASSTPSGRPTRCSRP